MNKFTKLIVLYINGFFPFIYPNIHLMKKFNYLKGIKAYYADLFTYLRLQKKSKTPFSFSLLNSYPILFDRYEEAGEVPKHYFLQDLWAAKKIFHTGVKTHYDIGSRLDSFISHCLVFCKVVMLDVRPLKSKIPNLEFIKADCMNMKNIKNNSITSLSALHAVEHFGLGRYGDPIDPEGYIKAIKEMQRVTRKSGNIYYSGPIGKQRLEFNAHRVFNPFTIIDLFDKCELIEFSAVDDKDRFIEKTDPKKFVTSNYSCGLFHFVKK